MTRILDQISTDLAAGAIGVGVLIGYTPGVDPAEYLAVAELAATAGVPTFTHSRDIVELAPETPIDGAEEVVRAAGSTGAHMHYCHINSTSGRHIDRVLALVGRCQAEGARVTTEAYPYGSGSTVIGAAFFAPERLHERFRGTTSITYLRTGERIADEARLRELRATDPGGLVIAEFLDESEPGDAALLRRSLAFADAIVASDGMPPMWTDTADMDLTAWPLPPEAVTHPRTAGTFGRALRLWRQEGAPLIEAVRRATLLPAEVLQAAVPAMRRKGRVQIGADADLVVFDEARVTDQATYAASTRPSSGIVHVIVGGTFVVRDGELVPDALQGAPCAPRPCKPHHVRRTLPATAGAGRLSSRPAAGLVRGASWVKIGSESVDNPRSAGMIERMFVVDEVDDDTVLEVAAHPAAIIAALAALDRRQAAITAAVGEFDRDQSWALDGARSMKAWLVSFTGRSAGDAARLVRHARSLRQLPVTAAAYTTGQLAGGQIDAIIAHLSPATIGLFADHEPELIPTLVELPVRHVER